RQDAEVVHAPQLVHNAAGLLQNAQEKLAVDRIVAKLRIDAIARVPQSSQRAHRKAVQLRVLLQYQECPQQKRGLALEAIIKTQVQATPSIDEVLVDVQGRRVVGTGQPLFDVEYQDAVELRHQLG